MKPHHKKISLAAFASILLVAAVVFASLELWGKKSGKTPDEEQVLGDEQPSVAYSATGRVKGVSEASITMDLAVAGPDGKVTTQERVVRWYKTLDVVKKGATTGQSTEFVHLAIGDLRANMQVAVYSSSDISLNQEFFAYRVEVLQ